MKLQKYISKVLDVLIALVLLLFFASFGFRDGRISGWYQQFMPNLNGQSVSDVFFLDSLTGWAVTGINNGPGHINYLIKTTNGGDNWNIIFTDTCFFSRINFINSSTGYACGGSGGGTAFFYKSTNGGMNWQKLISGANAFEDMTVLNQDTVWVVDHNSLGGGVFLTTNSGISWTQQFSGGAENPNKIYMFNSRIGFIVNNNTGLPRLRKTTNAGNNWSIVASNEKFYCMYFTDSLTGWKSDGEPDSSMKKTTNGGLNWVKQNLPQGGYISALWGMANFSNINKDTIWGVGSAVFYPNNQVRPILYRTTNGGNNWNYQIPDTSIIHNQGLHYTYTEFINKYIGWAYSITNQGIHTLTGGDTTFILSVHQNISETPKDYKLYQNYPNPFNAKSNIKYQISKISHIQIKIFDVQGKEISILVNKKLTPGTYEYNFDASNLSSGIYFYTLYADGNIIDTKKAVLLK